MPHILFGSLISCSEYYTSCSERPISWFECHEYKNARLQKRAILFYCHRFPIPFDSTVSTVILLRSFLFYVNALSLYFLLISGRSDYWCSGLFLYDWIFLVQLCVCVGALSMRKGAVCYVCLCPRKVTFYRIKTTMLSIAVSLCVVWETKLLAVVLSVRPVKKAERW